MEVSPRPLNSQAASTLSFVTSLDESVPHERCHPKALKYRKNFHAHRMSLANRLFNLFNREVFQDELQVRLVWSDRLKSTSGYTRLPTANNSDMIIALSTSILINADRLRHVLLHEMCHVAVFQIDQIREAHGPNWQKWVTKAQRVFPEIPRITVYHTFPLAYNYKYVCRGCNMAHARMNRWRKIMCRSCGASFDIFLYVRDINGRIFLPRVGCTNQG